MGFYVGRALERQVANLDRGTDDDAKRRQLDAKVIAGLVCCKCFDPFLLEEGSYQWSSDGSRICVRCANEFSRDYDGGGDE